MAGLLTTVGTALGGFMQGYDSSRQKAQEQQMRQMAMQQANDANVAKGLAGFALQQGGVLSPTGGVPASQQGPQPPMPGQPSTPAQPQAPAPAPPPLQPSPYGPGPGMPTLPQPSAPPPMQGSASSPDLGRDEQTPDPEATVAADAAAEPPAQPSPAATTGASAPLGGDAPGGASPAPAAGGVQPPGQPFIALDDKGQQVDIRPFLPQHFDPQQIAQRIKAARPGATDAQVWDATEMVYKLAESGNKNDVASTGLLLRALGLQIQGQRAATTASQGNARIGIAQQNADTSAGRAANTANLGQQRIDQGNQRIAMSKERLAQQATEFKTRLSQAMTSQNTSQRGQALRAMLSDVDRNINAPVPPDEGALKQLQAERAQLVTELRKITGMSGVQPLPAPAPAPQPSGGFHLPWTQ